MGTVNVTVKHEYYSSVTDVDARTWDAIVPTATGLLHNVLSTFELSGVNGLVCHYLLFSDGERNIGKANIYETAMDFTTMDQSLTEAAKAALTKWHPNFLNFTMAECGLFAMNGDGVVVEESDQLEDVISQIDEQLNRIAKQKKLDLLVFRDVPLEQYTLYESILTPKGYSPALGFTNAVIDIEWNSIEDYLQTVNSKTRHKLKSALKISEKLDINIEITRNYAHLAKQMAQLWANVNASSSDYSREKLDEAFFYEAGLRLSERSEVILFFHKDQLVAFMWNLIGDEDYHMADWGVDYQFPQYKEANFYRVASVLSLERAITLGKKRMQLGMTNYTPKKLLGAKMQPLVYFIKHRESPQFSKTVCKMITDAIEQPDELNYYHSQAWPENPLSSGELKEAINNNALEYKAVDAFGSIEEGFEIDLLKVGGLYGFYPPQEKIVVNLAENCFFNRVTGANSLSGVIPANGRPPFFGGEQKEATALQESLAQMIGKPAVQLFSNGSSVHAAAIPALLGEDSIAVIDEHCGPLIHEAIRLAGCGIQVFSHNDMAALEATLAENQSKKIVIIVESLFSLFGDTADLDHIVRLRNRYSARLYVDESHAFGILGPQGRGRCHAPDIRRYVDVIAASTFSATGLDIGFVAAESRVVEHIRHRSSHLIFSPSPAAGTLSLLVSILADMQQQGNDFQALVHRVDRFVNNLRGSGFNVINHSFPIINLAIGDYVLALAIQKYLAANGIAVSLLGPPMVPPEMAMLRIVLGADISQDQLDFAMGYLHEVKEFLSH